MQIKKAHCFFEQSGTFKNAFKHYGIDAEDYDLQNNFGETDNVIDLFAEIEKGYDGKPSIFDRIDKDDLIMAFFPCVYFCAWSQMAMYWGNTNYRKKSIKEKTDLILERSKNREKNFSLAVKMLATAKVKGLRLVMENPWGMQTYLKANFIKPPSLVDMDRTKRGDVFMKPTAYWFINCEPTHIRTYQQSSVIKRVRDGKKASEAGRCSEERSMISPDYALNFINDFLRGGGKRQGVLQQVELF
jgi:hypothetical protein